MIELGLSQCFVLFCFFMECRWLELRLIMVYGSPSAIADGRPARLVCEVVFEKHTEAGNGDIKKVAVEAVYPCHT